MPWWWNWLLMIVSLVSAWLVTGKRVSGWWIGLVMQVLWIVYALGTGQYGFLVGAVVFGVVNVRGIVCWSRDDRVADATRCTYCSHERATR